MGALERGSGSIKGMVRDRDGRPVEGVDIVLMPPQQRRIARRSSESTGSAKRIRTLEETLERAAEDWTKREGQAHRATSGPDGSFVLEGLPERTFSLRGESDGWRLEVDGPRLVAPGDDVSLIASPTRAFRLTVHTSEGTSVDRALLNVQGDWLEWEASDPLVHVSSRQVQLSVIAEPYGPDDVGERRVGRWFSGSIPVDVASDGSTEVEVELEPNCVLVGRMEGGRHGSAGVFALPLRQGESFDASVQVQGASTGYGNSGLYVISGLTPGRHAVGVRDQETEIPISHQVIELVDGLNRVDLTRGALDLARYVAVRSLAPDGTRLESVSYGFEWTRDGGNRQDEWVNTLRDVEGRDLVHLDNFGSFDIDDWPSGTRMWLYGRATGFGKITVPYEKGQLEATLRFEPPCELRVAVEGDFRAGGYSVVVYDGADEGEDPSRIATASQRGRGIRISRDGVAHFRGLAPGPVIVRLERAVRWWGRGLEVDEKEVVLSGTSSSVTLTAAPLNHLSVVVTPVDSDRSLRLVVLDPDADDGERSVAWSKCSASGRATFRALPAGEYVVVDQESGARLDVIAPSPEIAWDLSDYEMEVTVSVSTRDGKLVEWGFQGGDVIIAMDGEPLASEDAVLDQLALGPATVTVRRGEETIQIELPRYPRDVRRSQPMGGRMYVDD